MSKVPEEVVAAVVTEVSQRMSEPAYAQVAIGTFVQEHPDAGRFITAHLDALGGGEGVMHTVFHAQVIDECFRRHRGGVGTVGFRELDLAAKGDAREILTRRQPALASYVASNVDDEAQRNLLALIAVAMDGAS
ncbi:MAG: hypothetical protein H6719_16105 [Sandaracinaceae bacterium]|nr:hypothetical protein [Sandaracinaceae bacterium]